MTDFHLLDSIYPLALDELPRQWVLGRGAAGLPQEWEHRTFRGWTLAAHRDAHVCRLEDGAGAPIGWVLEPMLHTDAGGAATPKERVRLAAEGEVTEAALEHALYGRDANGHSDGTGLEGMWIAIVLTDAIKRVYLGPIHSVMFDAAKRRIATSHNLLQPFARDLELSRAFDPLATLAFFSFGLTAFRGVERLLPNHYLDLDRFAPVRHWPRVPAEQGESARIAAAMTEHGRRIIAEIAREEDSITIPLSAGNDSRAVLAACRSLVEAGFLVKLFTSVGTDFDTRIDLQGASALARIAGLPLEVRSRQRHAAAPAEQVMRMFARLGEAKSGPSLSNPALLQAPLPLDASGQAPTLTLPGMGGEVGRGTYYWGDAQAGAQPAELLRRVGTPLTEQTVKAADRWLQNLPAFIRDRPADLLDLAYVEQRLGCWEANTRYLWPGRPKVLSFMVSGFCIEQVFRLPVAYRRSGRLQRDMIAYGWPELLAVPINRATGFLWFNHQARKIARPIKRRVVGALRR